MGEVATRRRGAVTQYDPKQGRVRIAALDSARKFAQSILDWDELNEAIIQLVEEQEELVGWWNHNVSVRHRPGRGGAEKLNADRGAISVAQAEKEIKIRQQQVSRWRKALRNKEKYKEELRGPSYKAAMGEKTVRGTEGTGENEWFTPAEFIERARKVLGVIDLDPASNPIAQETVLAAAFFTKKDNGLEREWNGRVWLNPPYAQPFIAQFISKLVAEIRAGRVSAAISLTHNYTDTSWFHEAVEVADAICFTRGRVKFYEPDGEIAAPTQGQAFSYFGNDVALFVETFSDVGFVVRPERVRVP